MCEADEIYYKYFVFIGFLENTGRNIVSKIVSPHLSAIKLDLSPNS